MSLPSLLLHFLKIGAIGFGGGMAVVALMERDLVRQRQVMDSEEFLHGVALGQVLGPFAVNASVFVGTRLHGPLGGLACAGAFTAPSLILVILLSWLYFTLHAIPALQGAIGGLGPVVIALILGAAWSMGAKAVRAWPAALLAVLALGVSLLKINPVATLVVAGVAGLMAGKTRLSGSGRQPPARRAESPRSRGASVVPGLALMPGTGVVVGSVALGNVTLASIAWTFLKVGFVFFGGGFVLVPVLRQTLVENFGWLSPKAFIDGVAISNLTPGPIAVLATFAGFHVRGIPGALVATLSLFAPALVLMLLLSSHYGRLKEGRRAQDFLAGVTPAVVGLVIGAAVLLAPGALHGVPGWGLMVLSVILLTRLKWHPAAALAIGAALGAAGLVT
jgi:chromate transporter